MMTQTIRMFYEAICRFENYCSLSRVRRNEGVNDALHSLFDRKETILHRMF